MKYGRQEEQALAVSLLVVRSLLNYNEHLIEAASGLEEVSKGKHCQIKRLEEQDDQLGLLGSWGDCVESQNATAWEKMPP